MDFIFGKNAGIGTSKAHWAWKFLFGAVVLAYCLAYSPYGINETDGGFITGLAWQVLSGKTLYDEVIYVRPPLTVWWRALEMSLLPEHGAVLWERWIFYLKVGAYSWLGASVLAVGERRWMLATLGFVVSAHCYPPMAWHTVDGILFAVWGVWFWSKVSVGWGAALAGIAIAASLLCKQSFYPMAVVFLWMLLLDKRWGRLGWGVAAFCLVFLCFFAYLKHNDLLLNYLQWTGGAASGSQAFQHGLLDYFRVKPILALASLACLPAVVWYFWKEKNLRLAKRAWLLWLFFLGAFYAYELLSERRFVAPFAQSRLLFWVGVVYVLWPVVNFAKARGASVSIRMNAGAFFAALSTPLLALLAVSWCASVSWGYNLPILFAVPWVFAAMDISRLLWTKSHPVCDGSWHRHWPGVVVLLALLGCFRLAYEFVYRDGRRGEMTAHFGDVFPALHGIYTTQEKMLLYRDLKNLAVRYPNFKTLPAFPQANFLTRTRPPLPLDWVVEREMGQNNALVLRNLKENEPVLFVEKKYADKIKSDPEMRLTHEVMDKGVRLEETLYFWVLSLKSR
ncbi:MAG: hypothetical protein KF734_02695 [Saprospiraceae bacterium]|nr:hypothetical protein [Saprospiraceae bacterium]